MEIHKWTVVYKILINSAHILAFVLASVYCASTHPVQNASFKMTINVVSWFGKEQINLVSQSKLFDTIVRHFVEIKENEVITYLTLKILSPYYLTTMSNDFEVR